MKFASDEVRRIADGDRCQPQSFTSSLPDNSSPYRGERITVRFVNHCQSGDHTHVTQGSLLFARGALRWGAGTRLS